MIEAIPASADSIVLIITKVEDPEELDTRFSKFTPLGEIDSDSAESLEKLEGAEEFLNLLNKVKSCVRYRVLLLFQMRRHHLMYGCFLSTVWTG